MEVYFVCVASEAAFGPTEAPAEATAIFAEKKN